MENWDHIKQVLELNVSAGLREVVQHLQKSVDVKTRNMLTTRQQCCVRRMKKLVFPGKLIFDRIEILSSKSDLTP